MKRIFLLAFAFVFTFGVLNAQEGPKNEARDKQQTIEAIEETITFYMEENMDIKLPDVILKSMQSNSELTSEKQKKAYLDNLKASYLRHLFFEKNPTLKHIYYGNGQSRSFLVNPCDDGDFEGSIAAFDAETGERSINGPFNVSPTNISTNATSTTANYIQKLTLVQPSNDPIVQALSSGSSTLNRVKTGNRAIRINQNLGYHTQWTREVEEDNHEFDALIKEFIAESNTIKFDYAQVMEWAIFNHTGNQADEHPYFLVRITDVHNPNNPRIIVEDTIRPTDGFHSSINFPPVNGQVVQRLKYTQWKNASYDIDVDLQNNTVDMVDRKVELRLEVADCSESVHGGYVYVDNITNNCPPAPTCPPSSCLSINAGQQIMGNCVDAQAWMNCPNQDMGDIDWYFSLGPVVNQYIGTTNNPGGSHAKPFTLPTPPQGQTWDNYYLWIHADIELDGNQCARISKSIILDCDSGGGVKTPEIQLMPNPAASSVSVSFEGIDSNKLESIQVFDIYGNRKIQVSPKDQSFNTKGLTTGIYFVNFYTLEGEVMQKKLLIK